MWRIFIASRQTRQFLACYIRAIAILLFIFHSVVVTGAKASTGDLDGGGGQGFFCKSSDDCDQTRFLGCFGNICNCGHGQIWVPEENSCMVMEDAYCGRKQNEPNCISNSTCERGRCECDDGFLRNGFGNCELTYGSVCSEKEPCAKRYLLECSDGSTTPALDYQYGYGEALLQTQQRRICLCKDEGDVYVWDERKRKCVSTAGGACDLPEENLFGRDDQLECIKNAKCVKRHGRGICECENRFVQTSERTCLLQYGERCDFYQGPKCDENLLCQEGKCQCQFHGQQEYDEEAKQCKWLVGESCNVFGETGSKKRSSSSSSSGSGGGGSTLPANQWNYKDISIPRECGKDAYCKPRPGYTNGRCACLPGFEESNGKCSKFRGHGQPCSGSVDCDKGKFLECVFDKQVGKCECRREMFHDGKQCRVYPGKRCLENRFCSQNSYCEGEWCVCNEGYEIRSFHSDCVKKVGTAFSTEYSSTSSTTPPSWVFDSEGEREEEEEISWKRALSACDDLPDRSLEWKKCQCELSHETHIWIANETSCLALVGTQCAMDSECIPHATCHTQGNICQCLYSKLTTKSKTCVTPSFSFTTPKDYYDNSNDKHHKTHEEQYNNNNHEFHTLASVGSSDSLASTGRSKVSFGSLCILIGLIKLIFFAFL